MKPLIASMLIVAALPVLADVRLPEALSDHMVLQQNAEVTLWGWTTTAGSTVDIETSWGIKAQARSDDSGEWRVKVKTPAAQTLDKGLRTEHITFSNRGENTLQLQDILIGEVWLLAGQSNMEVMLCPVEPKGAANWYGEQFWGEESKYSDRPGLRLLNIIETAAMTPQKDCKALFPSHLAQPKDANGLMSKAYRGWQPCSIATAPYFSAVAYYFGATLQAKLKVPVGLVTASGGATPIETWMSLDALLTIPGYEKATTALNRDGPAGFFNGMIAPLLPMAIKGVCWYQGESNLGLRGKYAQLLRTLIGDWRKRFGGGDIPFYVVQLVPFGDGRDGNQAELREAQTSALQLNKTGLVVTNDLAERDNIHPKNKRDVGRRLAWQALSKTYGSKDVVADGPTFQSCELNDAKIQITFRDIGGGLVSRDGRPLTCFEVAGADGKIVSAKAVIEGDKVIVSAPNVTEPKFVYFAWGDGDTPNLMSRDGLPAAQFRAKLPKLPE
jgi:sialate O-acetylesterase